MQIVVLICVVACASVLLLVIAGVTYQRWGSRRDRRLMAPGELTDIGGGRRLYLLRKGQGTPTVVFESGFAATSLNWREVQDAVSETAQTVVYDRGGLGWSAGPTAARTPAKIAAELRAMLREAGIAGPYVLVGHSFGGLVMRRFALDHPEEVAGVVLVDPMRTEEWPPVNTRQQAMLDRSYRMTGYAVHAARVGAARLAMRSLLCRSGRMARVLALVSGRHGRRLFERLTEEVGKMSAAARPSVAAHWANPEFFLGVRAHLESLTASVEEMHDAAPIEGVPVLVLTPVGVEALSEEALQKIGVGARQVIAEKSRHWVHLDEPELVIAAILEMRGAGVSEVA